MQTTTIRHRIVAFGLFLFAAISSFNTATAQPFPYWKQIQDFKKQDSIQAPPQNAILFIGSSSFTKWKDVQAYFPDHTILNRGFGGSSLPDLIRYAQDIIIPYHPKQIVIYCGDNDLAAKEAPSPRMVLDRYKILESIIRRHLGSDIPIAYVSIKPSESRRHLMPKMEEANRLIQDYMAGQPNATFIDVYHAMLDAEGNPKKDIFIEDRLHMNEKGYQIWQQVIAPYLL